MKKIYSFCAFVLFCGASVAQIATKTELIKKAPVAVEQMQQVQPAIKAQLKNAQALDPNLLSATPTLKINNADPKAIKKTPSEQTVVLIKGKPSIYQDAAKNVAIITVEGEDGNAYGWGVKTSSLEYGKTYTFADMDINYTYWASSDWMEFEDATDATFTITKVNEADDIVATLVAPSKNVKLVTTAPKPDAKEISIKAQNANLNTKTLAAGVWTVEGQTADKNNSFNLYFMSKALQGTFTAKDLYSYNTWVSDKSSGSNVYYENISEANITSAVVGDSLIVEGTLNLSDSKGNPAIVTLHVTTPFAQEWGEWTDFAPFDKNTGKYAFTALGDMTQIKVQVQTRKDNTGLKQFVFKDWGAGYFAATGVDLTIDMNPDYSCTIKPLNFYIETIPVIVTDAYTATGSYASDNYYDPENGIFHFYTVFLNSNATKVLAAGKETMTMDRPIYKRDTVDIVSTILNYNDNYLASDRVVIYYASDVPGYPLFRVTSANATSIDGTFSWADGTISSLNSYFITSDEAQTYFQDGEFTVVTKGKDIALTGWMIGTDEKYYRLDMSYTAPLTRDTVKVSGTDITIMEDIDDYGIQLGWLYQMSNADYNYIILQSVGKEKYGTFSYDANTLGRDYYNLCTIAGARQQFKEGSMTVGEVGDSIILDGELIAEDDKVYILHFAQNTKQLSHDTDAPFNAEFQYDEMKAYIEKGVINIKATNADKQTIGLELYCDPTAIEIPAGMYIISDTQEAGTALKSIGITGGYLTECFAGISDDEGYISECWFMVDGTVTVSYDEKGLMSISAQAKNSYDKDVVFTINATTPSGVNQIMEKAEEKDGKFLVNGRLLIRHNNQIFDAQGRQIR